eukprot:4231_1
MSTLLTIAVTLIMYIFIPFTVALCSSTDYSNKMRNILSQQNEYNVYEGQLIFPQNKSYPQQNPSGIYGTTIFHNPSVRVYEAATEYTYYLRASNLLIFAGCTPPKSSYF